MTATEQVIADKMVEIAKDLQPDALGAAQRLVTQHGRMTEALKDLKALDPSDPGFPAADDEYDVQRGLWFEAVELEAKIVGTELFLDIIKVVGAYIGA